MKKPYLLQKLAPVGVATFSALSVFGIQAVPAHAVGFTAPLSTLEWDNGTSSFVEEAAPLFIDNLGDSLNNPAPVGGDFSVTFSPQSLGGVAAVFIATGNFDDFFEPPELVDIIESLQSATTFEIVSEAVDINGVLQAEFELTNDLIFPFDVSGPPADFFDDDVFARLLIGDRPTFLGQLLPNGTVEFELEKGDWVFGIPPDPSVGTRATSSEFIFGQAALAPGGGYQAEGVVTTPEPATILGLLAVGGLGFGLKRKKQS